MGYPDNPAGRLHTLLTRYGSNPAATMEKAWADAMAVDLAELVLHIGRVANLLEDVKKAYEEVGDEGYAPILGHLQTLSRCIWPRDMPITQQVAQNPPDQTAMDYLVGFDVFLHRFSSEGEPVDREIVADLVTEVGDLIGMVAASRLAPQIKRMILNRLNGVLEALEHLDVGGPDAVRRATESLATSAAAWEGQAEDEDREIFEKVKKTASNVYKAFKVIGAIAAATHALQLEVPSIEHVLWPAPPAQIEAPKHAPHEQPPAPAVEAIVDAEVVEGEEDETT
jgi:hypothetical protein